MYLELLMCRLMMRSVMVLLPRTGCSAIMSRACTEYGGIRGAYGFYVLSFRFRAVESHASFVCFVCLFAC